MKSFRLSSISRNLYVLVILAIMPALAIILYSGLEQRQRSIENAQHDVLLLTHAMAETQQEFTRSVRQMLSILSLLPEIQNLNRQPCREIFGSVLEQNPNYLNIALTDLNGEVLVSGKPLTATNFRDRKHVRGVLERQEFSIGEYIISRIGSATPAFAFAYPVLDKNNRLKAVLTTATKLAHISDFHDISNLPEKSFVALTDHKGIRLFYYPPKEDTNPVGKPIKTQSWEKASKAKEPGIFVGHGSDGVRRIFAFEQVRFKPDDTPYLYAWTGTPEAYVLSPANAALTRNLLFLTLATVLSLFISWLIGKKTLLSPIQSIVNLTRKFAQGDLEARSKLTAKPDEFGTLTKAFHDMADTLAINQRTLRESEDRYRSIIENASVGIFQTTPDGRYLSANRAGYEMWGFSSEEEMIEAISDLATQVYVNAEDRKRFKEIIERKGRVENFEAEFYTKDKIKIWCSLNSRAIYGDGGQVKYYETFIQDITERKRMEDEKAIVEAQLQQSQKMEAIGTLAGGIAHDFNNLLMGIQGRTSLMMMDTDSYHPYNEHLKGIEDYVQSAADLTKQLLAFARGGKYEIKPINLNRLINKSAEMFGRTKKEITIHRKNQENIWTVEVDQGQVEQVMMNLYVNAWQSMPGGGKLYLETENVMLDVDYVKPHSIEPDKYVKISITDTGVGMDKATQERIFEPFFTTKEMGRGTGLGLASAYGIVKNHNGFINVYSEEGEGTTFNIYLPASEKEVIDEKRLSEEVIKGEETVLLVDDEDMVIKVGSSMLEKMGYDVLAAKGGKEAIEIYEKNEKDIDLVIIDMIMPGMGGGETYDKLKEISPNIKVLLSSGYSINGQATEILDRGCDGFIQKPFSIIDLSQKIREILDRN